jgi:hypothetical protein
MMVYNTSDYWVFGFYPPSGILKRTMFRKVERSKNPVFPSLVFVCFISFCVFQSGMCLNQNHMHFESPCFTFL